MANASGLAADGFLAAKFTHPDSGVSYRISEARGIVSLEFSREAAAPSSLANGSEARTGASPEALKGRRELRYFLGSGRRGRTYLFEDEGYWFEIPINWYAKKRVWDMAPNFLHVKEMPLALPVDPGCLRCHSSGAQASLPEARNKYAAEPFAEGGITCSTCHGDATSHVASGGKAAMMKLKELEPARRDSICLSCHLEGQAAVVRLGKRLVDFRPGESIFDYARFFVHEGSGSLSGGRATSQWEALLQSACKRGAGDKLTCTTCHDPHGTDSSMSAAERIGYYRARCLECHGEGGSAAASGAAFVRSHHPENADCAGCHMARGSSSDIAHEQVTDHRIVKRPAASAGSAATTGRLVAVGAAGMETASDRDLGLGYAQMAARGDREAAAQAQTLLRAAEKEAAQESNLAQDGALHAQLGFLDQIAGDKDGAAREYGLALAADAHDSFAAGNLALVDAGEKQYNEAIALWERAFEDDPVALTAGMNLAIVECGLGKKEAAMRTLARMLEFSPDDGQAKSLERAIRSGERQCRAR